MRYGAYTANAKITNNFILILSFWFEDFDYVHFEYNCSSIHANLPLLYIFTKLWPSITGYYQWLHRNSINKNREPFVQTEAKNWSVKWWSHRSCYKHIHIYFTFYLFIFHYLLSLNSKEHMIKLFKIASYTRYQKCKQHHVYLMRVQAKSVAFF